MRESRAQESMKDMGEKKKTHGRKKEKTYFPAVLFCAHFSLSFVYSFVMYVIKTYDMLILPSLLAKKNKDWETQWSLKSC